MPFIRSSILDPRSRVGGPRQVREFLLADGDVPIDPGFGGGIINFDPIAPLPQAAAAAGLTLAQLDQVARLETQEGAPIGIFYGKLLFGSGTIVSHKYISIPPKENNFVVLLGEGWGGLGARGEWERIVKAWWAGQELTNGWFTQIYVNDRLPAGAAQVDDTDGWNWIRTNPTPYFGKYCHQSPPKTGVHQHYFTGATETMDVVTNDTLFCFIYIDPVNTPQAIMLQFQDGTGSFEHRAYWGPNVFSVGTNGTDSRRQISASIPATGQWVRLDVPAGGAGGVGMAGQTCKGMAFTLFDGRATWDKAGRWKSTFTGGNYLFRPGIISTDTQSILHAGVISLNTGLTYSGSANVVVRLTEAQSAEDRPDRFKCIAECRRTFNYDATGAEIGYGYAPSPARAVADRFLHFFQRRFRERLDIAQEKFRARNDWPTWTDFRDNSAYLIPWDREGNGVNVFVPRAEFHGGWVGDVTMAQVLDEVCGQAFTFWQDDGEKIRYLPPGPREPVHHFHPGNITRAPQRSTQRLKSRPNRVIGHFRDIEDDFLPKASVEPPDNTDRHRLREDSINKVGEVRSERQFGNMTFSQASRLTEYVARIVHDNPVRVNLVGNATAIHIGKGDLVTVSHPGLGWDYQLCLVLTVRVRSAESSADEVEVNLQKIDGQLYDDAAHKPRQPALTLP